VGEVHGLNHVKGVVNEKDAIKLTATVSLVEQLLQTELYTFRNSKNNAFVIKHLGELSLPAFISEHVQLVTGITEFAPTELPFIDRVKKPSASKRTEAGPDNQCNVPWSIKNLYGIPQNLTVTNLNANQSIYAEVSAGYPEGFGLPGLDYFDKANNLPVKNITCILGTGTQYYSPNDTDLEGHLDTQMMSGIAPGADTCFYIMDYGSGWMYEFAAYVFSTPGAPWVVSMSYGWVEVEQCINATTYPFLGNCSYYHIPNTAAYINRTNIEFMKLGLLGHTLLAASGDDGTAGTHGSWDDCQKLGPIYPAASPWVIAVGATSVEQSTSSKQTSTTAAKKPPVCTNSIYNCVCSTSNNEQPALSSNSAGFDTGGGFSQFSPMQSFQSVAVNAYLTSGVTLPTASLYNPKNRAFPDIGAVGEDFCCLDPGGSCFLIGGTSASTPLIAGMITLLNQDRMNAGKSPLGFFAPTIYKMFAAGSDYFNSNFTDGNNSGECPSTNGFNAWPGWNPLVGVGSPIFPNIRTYVSQLP